ncbi:MAG: ATP-dependent DNA ligase [Pseudonocardiaceae bacterium]
MSSNNALGFVSPMLAAMQRGGPPSGPGWAWEFKWDGLRVVAVITGGVVRLRSRLGNEITSSYPEVVAALTEVTGGRSVVLDGEIVALDAARRPDIGVLQRRMHVQAPKPALVRAVPTYFYVFDVLHDGDRPLLRDTYAARRAALAGLGLAGVSDHVQVPPSFTAADGVDGPLLLDVARAQGIEGLVSKRLGSRYEPGRRSGLWLKTVLRERREVVVSGWRTGANRRLGAVMLGAYDTAGRLRYLGDVGSGFTESALDVLWDQLVDLERPDCPFGEPVDATGARWVAPVLVGEVEFRGVTRDHHLRYAAWKGLRVDKLPAGVLWEVTQGSR